MTGGEKHYYVLLTVGDVDPVLHGPYRDADHRDSIARILRAGDTGDLKDGLFRLDLETSIGQQVSKLDHKLTTASFSGGFFDDEEISEC